MESQFRSNFEKETQTQVDEMEGVVLLCDFWKAHSIDFFLGYFALISSSFELSFGNNTILNLGIIPWFIFLYV